MSTPAVGFNPFDRTWWADPYPLYRRLHEEAPVGQVPGLDIWYFARYGDCEAILRDGRFGVDDRKSTIYEQFLKNSNPQRADDTIRSFLFMDPPDHTRLRGFVSRAFTPRVIEKMRATIASTVSELFDRLEGEREFDVIASIAYPLPITVICELLGIPTGDRGQFHKWSRHLVAGLDPELIVPPQLLETRKAAIGELRGYIRGLIDERRKRPLDDLVSNLSALSTASHEAAGTMADVELISTLVLLLVAGYETTVNLIGNGVLAFARDEQQTELVAENPQLVSDAVEEVLRYDPPVQLTSRIALNDVAVGGTTVAKGAFAIVLIASANRDGERFHHPDRFDVQRGDIRHLSFSFGAHHCLGAPLARIEAQLAFAELLRRHPRLALAGEPRYRDTLVLRGIEYLPVSAH